MYSSTIECIEIYKKFKSTIQIYIYLKMGNTYYKIYYKNK